MAQMSKLPLELYRPVCELLKFEDLLNITLVCRAFQREAGRYLLWKLIFRGLKEDGVAECVERFLRFPRSHQYVQRLDVFASREAVADSLISLLLGKLTNLIALTLCGRQYCGNIFENSTFQLHFLFTSFVLDQEFSAFLKTQPSITEWRTSSSWESSPGRDERDRLSPDILPNLAVFCNSSNDPNFDIQIHNGRNITHISMAQFSAPVSLPKLPHPLHVKALDVYCAAMELLEVLPDILPNLECLALIDYDAIEGDTFISSILPRFQRLTALEIRLECSQEGHLPLAYKIKEACPTLQHLQLIMDESETLDFLDWDGWWRHEWGVRDRLDLFDESARRTHSPMLPSFSDLIREE